MKKEIKQSIKYLFLAWNDNRRYANVREIRTLEDLNHKGEMFNKFIEDLTIERFIWEKEYKEIKAKNRISTKNCPCLPIY